ncbi:MAG: sigma-70 family RNA polymerase sigma factor [Gammaproteobacteria bacterium]|nr:sigma-70 family RNA polymerase sigma factor [Gammaproteobacteria bacterium]
MSSSFALTHPEAYGKLQAQGQVTYDALVTQLQVENDELDISQVISELEDDGINVINVPDNTVISTDGMMDGDQIIDAPLEPSGSSDTHRAYMRDVGKYSLLKRDQEIDLGRQIYEGNQEYMSALATVPGVIDYVIEKFEISLKKNNLDHFLENFTDPVEEIPEVQQKKRTDSEHRQGRKKKLYSLEEAGDRLEALKAAYTHYLEVLETYLNTKGKKKVAPLNKARAGVENIFRFFLLTPRHQTEIRERLREITDRLDKHERLIYDECVKARVPRDVYESQVSGREHNIRWVKKLIDADEPYSERIAAVETRLRSAGRSLANEARKAKLDIGYIRLLESRLRKGEATIHAARDELILGNLRLVMSIARKYSAQGVPVMDLIQEGNMGMVKGIEKYDYRLGYKFSTYATWWIRQAISRTSHGKNRTVRLPSNVENLIRKISKTQDQLQQELSRNPTIDEISDRIEVEEDKIRLAIDVSRDLMSMDQSIGKDDDTTIGEQLASTALKSPEEIAHEEDLRHAVGLVLGNLSARDAKVVMLRFGIGREGEMTTSEVARDMDISPERVRQVLSSAIKNLKTTRNSVLLKPFLN